MNKVLIDSDVILDLFMDRQPFSEDSAQIFSLCEMKKIKGYVTPVIYRNVYQILRQGAGHHKVTEKLDQMLRIIKVLGMNKKIVLNAIHSDFKDLDEALQYSAAIASGRIDVILTRNVTGYAKSQIAVMTPATYLKNR